MEQHIISFFAASLQRDSGLAPPAEMRLVETVLCQSRLHPRQGRRVRRPLFRRDEKVAVLFRLVHDDRGRELLDLLRRSPPQLLRVTIEPNSCEIKVQVQQRG